MTSHGLTFKNILKAYDHLWDLGAKLIDSHASVDKSHCILSYRTGLMGAYSRVMLVDRHYLGLHDYQQNFDGPEVNPNLWAIECEYHAGAIFFGMDSSLECLVFALNALGYAISPDKFRNISDGKSLKNLGPHDILGTSNRKEKINFAAGYFEYFPRVTKLFNLNKELISLIIDYHDVTKHRSSVTTGGIKGATSIKMSPKDPTIMISDPVITVETISLSYQVFIDAVFLAALEDVASMNGCRVVRNEFSK